MLGIVAVAAGLAMTLSHASQRRSGTNGVWPLAHVAVVGTGQRACQEAELLPAGTAQLEVALQPLQAVGPRVEVTLSRNGRVFDHASRLVHARDGIRLTVPIEQPPRDLADVDVCLAVTGAGAVALIGDEPPSTGLLAVDDQPTVRALAITYLRDGTESWWSHAPVVVDRMALGRGDWGGRWVVWAIGASLLASCALVVRVLARNVIAGRGETTPRRVPAVAWAVAAVAMLNATAWSLVTPPFQVPDEPSHVAYAQQIAEGGRPPVVRRGDEQLAPELTAAIERSRFGTFVVHTFAAAVWSPLEQERLDRALHAGHARHGNDTAGPTAPEPPLFYALEAIPYQLASGATLLDRVALMRLLSAAMAGATALFLLLFLRECLPGRPWAWTVGGLGAALNPLLGFVSGGVNADALLFAICAALFHALAVVFRRGLTTRRAAWVGAVLAAGIVGKINFYGLVPGALLAVVLAARATSGGMNARAARLVGIALGIAVAPYLVMTALDVLVWDRAFALARTPAEAPQDHGSIGGQLSYLWQLFLPRLPGQSTAFPEYYPGYELWLKGFVGKFGWVVITFAEWAYRLAAVLLTAVVVLAVRAAARERAVLRRRRAELLGYGAMAGGLLLLIALVALRGWAPGIDGAIQGRYLLPLLPLLGGLLVLAARGAGERWGRAVGVTIVIACAAWSLFGQLLTIAWFYG